MHHDAVEDTCPDAPWVQIQLLRAAGPTRRVHLGGPLIFAARRLALRSRANPTLRDEELRGRFVALGAGQAVADGVRPRRARDA